MIDRGPILLCVFVIFIQLIQQHECQEVIDSDVKARLEAKVMQSMSLKELEDMVENDERVLAAPRSKLIVIPKRNRDDPNQEAYVIQRKPKASLSRNNIAKDNFRYGKEDFDDDYNSNFDKEFKAPLFRRSYLPQYRFESSIKFDEEFPSLLGMSDLNPENSNPVKNFYESVVEKTIQRADSEERLPMLDISSSEDTPSYKPRFAYDSYSRDPIEVKLKGKKYWKDVPNRRDETIDENGCRTVVKKMVDPEDGKKPNSQKAKTVVITKECESPSIDAPDAKIPDMGPSLRIGENLRPFSSYDNEPSSYQNSRPEELNLPSAKSRDALAPDYIDKMLEDHFKSFPTFSNPITSFRGYQDRFKLQVPSGFKDIKPTVKVESYDHSQPQSGFDERPEYGIEELKNLPKSNKHNYRFEYPGEEERKASHGSGPSAPKVYEHHHHYDYPAKSSRTESPREYNYKKEFPTEDKSGKKEPKAMKKSFAYYRKEDPKEDPNDQHYAEEYAQGNYRSFSSDYDSERDGPKKE